VNVVFAASARAISYSSSVEPCSGGTLLRASRPAHIVITRRDNTCQEPGGARRTPNVAFQEPVLLQAVQLLNPRPKSTPSSAQRETRRVGLA